MSQNNSQKIKFSAYANNLGRGHSDFGQGYHQGPYAYAAPALSSVASNSGHDINKPVATAQQGMYSSAGMPTSAQHHQSMGGPIASSQSIIQQGQQISRNPTITMPTGYFPRNGGPPRTIQNMTRAPISAVVNQPGQQPSSQYAPMPMVPLQHNFNSFPPTLVNPQFQQMYQQRAYNPPQYPIMTSQQYLWNYNAPPPQNSNELTLNGPEYNEDDMERKTLLLLDEFLRNNNLEETIKCVTELASPNTIHMFINTAVRDVLKRSRQARYSLGYLFSSLLQKKIITSYQYKKGFVGVLEMIDDYALDIPLIWDHIGEILAPTMEENGTPLKLIKEVLEPCMPSEKAGMLVSSILHCAVKWKIGEIWKQSGMQWVDIIGTERNVAEFLKKHKLEFTVSSTKDHLEIQLSMEEIKKGLLTLLEKNVELKELFNWINANISDTSSPTFVRALVTAVHEGCLSITGTTWELNESKLHSSLPLISYYVSTNENLQLQALYAIQALMNQLGQPNDQNAFIYIYHQCYATNLHALVPAPLKNKKKVELKLNIGNAYKTLASVSS